MGKAAASKRRRRKRGKFNHKLNRRNLKVKQQKKLKGPLFSVDITDNKGSLLKKIRDQGLVVNLNKALKPSTKIEDMFKPLPEKRAKPPPPVEDDSKKSEFVKKLESKASERRGYRFELPKGEVQFITFMMDKHGEDYQAMARDINNYNQYTWQQLRAKVNRFKKIPGQYASYLKGRGLLQAQDSNIANAMDVG